MQIKRLEDGRVLSEHTNTLKTVIITVGMKGKLSRMKEEWRKSLPMTHQFGQSMCLPAEPLLLLNQAEPLQALTLMTKNKKRKNRKRKSLRAHS